MPTHRCRPALRRAGLTALFAGSTLAVPRTAAAQVNIEGLRRSTADTGIAGTAGATLTARTGNVRLVLVAVETRTEYAGERWNAFAVGNTDIGWQAGRRFSNAGLVHLRVTRRLAPPVAIEGFGQIDYDKARLLAFRAVVGTGARLELTRNDAWHATAGTGYMFEHESLNLPVTAAHPVETNSSRSTSYLSVRFADGDRLAVAAIGYAQPRLDDFADLRMLGDVRLAVQLVGSLSLTVTSRLRYDSRPPDGIHSLDTAITTGLALEW